MNERKKVDGTIVVLILFGFALMVLGGGAGIGFIVYQRTQALKAKQLDMKMEKMAIKAEETRLEVQKRAMQLREQEQLERNPVKKKEVSKSGEGDSQPATPREAGDSSQE